MCSLCRLPVAKKPQLWANFKFWGLLYQPPFIYEGQIWCAIVDPQRTFTCQNLSRSVYSIALWRRKPPQFLPFFGLLHLVRKLNTGIQLQTFPYPTASKSFLYSNVFMVKSGAQSLTFKSVTDKMRDGQTKTQRFSPPRRRVKSDSHQTWHGDRGPRALSCISKMFGGLMHSFAARGHWKFGGKQTRQIKTP